MKIKKCLTMLFALVFVMGLICLFIAPKIDATIYGSIKGRVTGEDTGEGVPGIEIHFNGPSFGKTITDKEGKYFLQELKPGKYGIIFNAVVPYCGVYYSGEINIEPGKIVFLNTILKVGGSISGTVYKGNRATPLQGINILAGKINVDQGGAISGRDGRYLIPRLCPSDNYQIIAFSKTPGYGNKIVNGVTVEKGKETQGIDIIFDLDDITGIEGTITSSIDGKPLPGIDILIETGTMSVGTVTANEIGYYSIKNLDPGNYSLMASPPEDNLTFQEWSRLCKSEENIIVAKGKTTRIDLKLDIPSFQRQAL